LTDRLTDAFCFTGLAPVPLEHHQSTIGVPKAGLYHPGPGLFKQELEKPLGIARTGFRTSATQRSIVLTLNRADLYNPVVPCESNGLAQVAELADALA
jgi:hypothetical protein